MMQPLLQKALPDRIHIIDSLRGFTLLGIAIAHMTEQYYSGPLPEVVNNAIHPSVFDYIVSVFVGVFISGKFFMIFSFLFGMSFYLQLRNASGDILFLLKFAWRLLLLLGIGMIHHLHYRGDILSIYAILGFGLLFTYRLPDKYILGMGLLLVVDVPGILTRIVELSLGVEDEFLKQDQPALQRYYEIFKSGSYADLMQANLLDFRTKMEFQVWSGRLYITFGLFLLGYYFGKKKLFEDAGNKTAILKKYLGYAAWSLLGVFMFGVLFFMIGNGLTGGLSDDVNVGAFLSITDLLNACLAVIYVTGFLLLFQKEKWKNKLMPFYSAGRMGLTTYLMQTVFGLLIFSTLGLGLLSEFGPALSFLVVVFLFAVQMWIAKQWLGYFNYGLVEWVWRCFTNLRLEPLRKIRANSTPISENAPRPDQV